MSKQKKEPNKYLVETEMRENKELYSMWRCSTYSSLCIQGLHFEVCDYDNCMEIVGEYHLEGNSYYSKENNEITCKDG